MLLSLSLILLIGFSISGILNHFKIPGLLGMILTGILLGPSVFNFISPEILNNSSDLRQIALIVILMRAGLSLDLQDLKKIGRPAILMCFIPATFELLAVTLLAPLFLHVSYLEAALMGTVLAAVSPAVIVPRMLHLMESGYGKAKRIPQLILAGASVDDVYVIILFTAFLGMTEGTELDHFGLVKVPISVMLGLLFGIITGFVMKTVFKKLHIRDTIKVLILLSVSFLLVSFEIYLKPFLPMSGLLAVMALGGTILETYPVLAKRLVGKFSKIWIGAEIMLFVLVGAALDIHAVSKAGFMAILVILSALMLRIVGVQLCLIKTPFNTKERFFCSLAYLPKATVQAAIGSIPLANGVAAGNIILSVAVLSIMITAPLGAILIDKTYHRLLENK